MSAHSEAQARYVKRQMDRDPVGFRTKKNAADRKWQEANRAKVNAANRVWRRANPEKRAAHHAVYRAIRRGELTRATVCEHCDRTRKTEAAHTDYSKPLDVLWLCHKCHAILDQGGDA